MKKLSALLFICAIMIGHSQLSHSAPGTQTNQLDTPFSCDITTGNCVADNNNFSSQRIGSIVNNLFAIVKTFGDTANAGACTTNPLDGLVDCNIGTASNPIDLQCSTIGSTSPTICDLGSIARLQCDPTGACSFNLELGPFCASNGDAACKALVNPTILCDTTGICSQGTQRQTPRQVTIRNVVNIITSICNGNDLNAAQQNICSIIKPTDGSAAPDLNVIVAEVIPDNVDISSDVSSQITNQVLTNLNNHIAGLRSGAPTTASNKTFNPENQQFYAEQQWLNAYTQFAQLDSANDASTNGDATINLSNDGRWSIYLNMSYLIAEQARTDTEGGSETDTATLTLGSDYRINNNWSIGGSFAYSASDTEFGNKAGNKVESDSFNLALYASMYYSQFWSDFTLLYGLNQFDQAREVSCPASTPTCGLTSEIYRADYDGSVTGLTWSLGYDVLAGAFSFSPFLQLSHGTIDTDSYSEKASTTAFAPLEIDNSSRDYGSAGVGAYFRYVVNTKKAVFVPTLRIISTHSTEDETSSVSGRIIDSENSDFDFTTSSGDRNYLLIGTGFSFQLQNGNSGFIDIESLELFDDLDQYRFSAGWRWEL